jgi:Putative auto-transporter adhesin, head GIN domain
MRVRVKCWPPHLSDEPSFENTKTQPIMQNSIAKNLFLACLGFFVAVSMNSCGLVGARAKGDIVTEMRSVDGFDGVEVESDARVELLVGTEWSVEVKCKESVIGFLETFEKDGRLVIRFDRLIYNDAELEVIVTAPSWAMIEVSGSAEVIVVDDISGTDLNLDVSGSGRIDIGNAVFLDTEIDVTGSGDIAIGGLCDNMNIDISGSGKVASLGYEVKKVDVEISGSGELKTFATEKIDADISGSGKVRFTGSPLVIANITGSGSVEPI